MQIVADQIVLVQIQVKELSGVDGDLFPFGVVFQVVLAEIDEVRKIGPAVHDVFAVAQWRVQDRGMRISDNTRPDCEVVDQAKAKRAEAGQVDANSRSCHLF